MVSLLGFLLFVICAALILVIAWYFLLTDRDVVLAYAENFGRPVSGFAGKVVWVTGASIGLGEAIAYELASVGAKLILTARRKDLLERVKEGCLELSKGKLEKEDILVLPFDLANLSCHKEKVDSAVNHFGKIDVLINNAAVYAVGPIADTDIEVDKAIFEVNYFGLINLSKLVLKQFLLQGKGHFVVISSISGKYGVPGAAAYTGSKHALQGYFETLRIEYQPDKINVTMICPGVFSSSILSSAMTTKKDLTLQKIFEHYECVNMSSERCAHLTLVAAANKLFESWVAVQPTLFTTFAAQYTPDLYKYAISRIYTKKRIQTFYQGKWPRDIPSWKPLFS